MSNHILIKKKINKFNKKIVVSSDKSISIRTILLASQAVGISKISNLLESEDVLNSLRTIKKLGINYSKIGKVYYIKGYGLNGFNIKSKTVLIIIYRSIYIDLYLIYSRSYSIFSGQSIFVPPFICANPVIPGKTLFLFF